MVFDFTKIWADGNLGISGFEVKKNSDHLTTLIHLCLCLQEFEKDRSNSSQSGMAFSLNIDRQLFHQMFVILEMKT